jgi:CheY-like chemotaxis protein
MAPDILSHIFEPFFTTKPVGQGSGLGLAMVFGFIKQSNGHVTAESVPGEGSVFRLYLPSTTGILPKQPVPAATPTPKVGKKETILVVDDNDALRRIVVLQLVTADYHVLEAQNSDEALKLIETDTPIDLLFTDVVMPGGMDGRELAELAQRLRPSLRAVLTSGFSNVLDTATDTKSGIGILLKPYCMDALLCTVQAALSPVDLPANFGSPDGKVSSLDSR